ncbi:N-acetylglucosamine kinase [Paracoccus aminophilus]|uniref:ATPase, BadF/BadG/BcrA/BcrD type n=1 Tax=Paracoccus aminophilus JCM 7686 TaxID=1367847 RepID=S5YEJ8_PARAH|nr:BadF/BadG/BcrA/BcrD ATPase family protein [Paracoccus aminophilus]AGT09908.1 ATPase, BadF/BadG/BcrA/BcrD type [Paracoccus aminophilus JCM 7686]
MTGTDGRAPLAPEALILGVDIGGTKTHLRLRHGAHERDLIVPTADWRRREWQADASKLLAMAHDFVGGQAVDALAVGANGCDDQSECQAFEDAFRAAGAGPVRVVNDAELMPAAFGLDGQIGVVAGTGSIAVCRDSAGAMLVAGGWGWVIGDEGSAPSLVREAARTVALHLDCGGDPTEPLARQLFAALGIPSPARIGSRLVAQGNAMGVGRHAALVFDAADEGSALARQVIAEGGAALAALVQRLQMRGARADAVVAGGSVIASQPRLWQAFSDNIARLAPGLALHLHRGPPVAGAIVLADRLAAQSSR